MNFANVKTWTIQEGEVIVVKDSNNSRIIWQKQNPPDYSEPFYVENITNANETLSIKKIVSDAPTLTIQYSRDREIWSPFGDTSTTAITLTIQPGEKIYLRCNTNKWSNSSRYNRISGVSKVGGNIMSLLYGSNFTGNETIFPSGSSYNFYSLFTNNLVLINAKNLLLPATTLSDYCYENMFRSCTSLTTPPSLPATTLAVYCYYQMFRGCTALTSAPELLATTMINYCYFAMFQDCTSLTTPPSLPATTLALNCYGQMFRDCTALIIAPQMNSITLAEYCCSGMFNGCTALTSAPELPATTLATRCYEYMFAGCTALTSAPELPATTMALYCYEGMFNGCTALTSAPELPATTLANSCYLQMFNGCISLTSAPELPAPTLANVCYKNMFNGCIALTTVKCLATNISATSATDSWLYNVSSTGTFTKAAGVTWPTGDSGIPSGWTVQEV